MRASFFMLFAFCFLLFFSCSDQQDILGNHEQKITTNESLPEQLSVLSDLFDRVASNNNHNFAGIVPTSDELAHSISPEIANQISTIILALRDKGVSETTIGAYMVKGSVRDLRTTYTEKATPCHDAHEARMAQISAAAAVCVSGTTYSGNVPGVVLCLVGYEAGRLASESTFRKCIARRKG